MGVRLRQLALVADDLRSVEQEICSTLGVEMCFRDPGLAHFGLRHGLYPIGDKILEVVVPKADGTTAGRYLERRGGDGGYMVLLQVDDLEATEAAVRAKDLRIVHRASREGIDGIHLHPKDTGGAILSLDQATPPESWGWAGDDWEYHSLNGVVTDMPAAELQSDDPDALAARWGYILDHEVVDNTITFEDGTSLRFVKATDGRPEGLRAIDVVAADRSRAGESVVLSGATFNFI